MPPVHQALRFTSSRCHFQSTELRGSFPVGHHFQSTESYGSLPVGYHFRSTELRGSLPVDTTSGPPLTLVPMSPHNLNYALLILEDHFVTLAGEELDLQFPPHHRS